MSLDSPAKHRVETRRPSWTRCRSQQSTGEVLKFEANLAKVLLGSVILEGSDHFLQRKTAVDNGLQTIGCYRANHVLLIRSAANGNPADSNLIRKQCRDRYFSRKTSQEATSGRKHLPVPYDALVSAFEAIAEDYPVFRIGPAA